MIEENQEYTTTSGKEVKINTCIKHDNAIISYGPEISKILGKKDPSWEEWKNTMKNEEVVIGKTNDRNMPIGYRHKQSGKCLGLSKGNEVDPNLNKYKSNFDIQIQ